MRHLFSPEGSAALAATMEQRPLLAFDFDGTLASIMPRPAEARVSQEVAQRLDRLSQVLPLAIITGRSIDDVRGRLTFEPRFIIGSHGAEDPAAACGVKPSVFDGVRARLRELAAELDAAGVTVEDKHYSMALHYRLSPDRVRALELITNLVSGLGSDVNVYGGKMVMNVVAAEAPDKAQAVASLVAKCGTRSAVFVGDDVNDEPVFARQEPEWLTVRVGSDSNSLAKFYLDSSGEVTSMLERMLVLLGNSRSRSPSAEVRR